MKKQAVILMTAVALAFSGCASIGDTVGNEEDASAVEAGVEISVEDGKQESTDLPTEATVNTVEAERRDIPEFVEEEGVRETDIFADFIDGNLEAHDENRGWDMSAADYCEMYVEEYDCDNLHAVQFYAEDLDNDNVKELLMLVLYHPDEGDMLVFHSDKEGLTAWEPMENFFHMRVGDVYLLEDGTFEFFGGYGVGRCFKRYTQDGKTETLWEHFYWSTPTEDNAGGKQGNVYSDELRIYRDGVEEQYLECSVAVYDEGTPQEEGVVLTGDPAQFHKVCEDSMPKAERRRSFNLP